MLLGMGTAMGTMARTRTGHDATHDPRTCSTDGETEAGMTVTPPPPQKQPSSGAVSLMAALAGGWWVLSVGTGLGVPS